MLSTIKSTAEFLKNKTHFKPQIGIILGTGLGGLVNEIDIHHEIPYEDIPDFPVSTVEGHSGKLIFGILGGKNVVAMQGRFHFYEGYSMNEVVFPVRVMKYLGVEQMMVSNASGGVNPDFEIGDNFRFVTVSSGDWIVNPDHYDTAMRVNGSASTLTRGTTNTIYSMVYWDTNKWILTNEA